MHPNVIPFLGIINNSVFICVILAWITGAELSKYITHQPNADRLDLVSVRFILMFWVVLTLFQVNWYRQRPRLSSFP